ncbi:MAG: GWxTD domain-containing protein [Chlorobi bacterium]|nr:GWxTD domain-containing protein [Chlorobiota bacterium]
MIRQVLLLLLVVATLGAQMSERRSRSGYPTVSNLVGVFHAYPMESNDSSMCVIGYRLEASDLLFMRSSNGSSGFVAEYTVTVELQDTLGVVRFARVFRDSIRRVQPAGAFEAVPAWNTAIVVLAHGRYTMSVDVVQQQRQRMFWKAPIVLSADAQSIANASLTFVSSQASADTAICAQPWGGVIPFGTLESEALLVLPRSWTGRDKLQIECQLVGQEYPLFRGTDTVVNIPVTIRQQPLLSLPQPLMSGQTQRAFCVDLAQSVRYRTLRFRLDVRRAVPGTYRLLVVRPSTQDTIRGTFMLRWFSPPPYLLASRSAVDVMYYVLSDDEYRQLLEMPDSIRTAAVIEWWKQHDPTPATLYNEAMVEYFRRAYVARTKFATAYEPDGALTERGKVFILFGEPTRIESDLDPDRGGTETWYYTNSVRKRFSFVITEQGHFRLVAVESL